MPEAQRQHSGTHGLPLEAAADGVVLAPRVVDRVAFDEYVRRLRDEIDRSTRESELLARRAEAGAVILEQLERFIGENGSEIERAAEVLASIDERSGSTRELLDEIDRRVAMLDRISRDAEREAQARSEAFQNRLRSIVDAAMDRFEETEDQLTARAASARRELLDRLEQLRTRGETGLARLDERAAGIAAETEASLERLESRLEALHAPARDLVAELEARTSHLDALANEQAAALDAASDRAQSSQAALHVAAEKAGEQIAADRDSAITDLKRAADGILAENAEANRTAADEARAALGNAAAAAEAAGEALERQLGLAAELSASHELHTAIERCEAAAASVNDAAKQAHALQAQAEHSRSLLGEAIVESAARIDMLDARAEAVRSTGATEADRLEALLESAKKPVAETKDWIRALGTADAKKPHPLLADLIERVRTETRRELETELASASDAVAAMGERVAALEAVSANAEPKPVKRTPKRAATSKTQTKAPTKTSAKTSPKKPATKKAAAGSRSSAAKAQPAAVEPKPDGAAQEKKSA